MKTITKPITRERDKLKSLAGKASTVNGDYTGEFKVTPEGYLILLQNVRVHHARVNPIRGIYAKTTKLSHVWLSLPELPDKPENKTFIMIADEYTRRDGTQSIGFRMAQSGNEELEIICRHFLLITFLAGKNKDSEILREAGREFQDNMEQHLGEPLNLYNANLKHPLLDETLPFYLVSLSLKTKKRKKKVKRSSKGFAVA